MTIRYHIKVSTETTASKAAQGYGAFDGVTIVSACLDTLRLDVNEDDAEWLETVLDEDTDVVSYSAD
jgi:hypothetical protein